MEAVFFVGQGRAVVRQVPQPELQQGEVLLRVRVSALCGSELRSYRGQGSGEQIPGHEMAGEVVAANGVRSVETGQRVAVQVMSGCGQCVHCLAGEPEHCADLHLHTGGHAEYVALPAQCCLPLPDEVPWDQGVLLGGDTIGTPYHALRRLGAGAVDTAAVFGCGPVGLGAIALLHFLGVRTYAVEPIAYRRSLASDLGAAITIDPNQEDTLDLIRALTDGEGVQVAMDCSGAPATTSMALDSAAVHGRVALIGEKPEATVRPSNQFIRKELTVIGSWYFTGADYLRILDLYGRGLDVSSLVTHRFALEEADQAFATFASGQSGKVVMLQGGS
jgi:threonine dehydrogenase-like Zn-dependent dehydrogenase